MRDINKINNAYENLILREKFISYEKTSIEFDKNNSTYNSLAILLYYKAILFFMPKKIIIYIYYNILNISLLNIIKKYILYK